MNQRNYSIDLLRVIAAFGIVWLHVSHGMVTAAAGMKVSSWWMATFADAMSRWCVPVFVMISGSLLLSKSSSGTLFSFYHRRVVKLLFPLVFWTAFYLGFKYCLCGRLDGVKELKLVYEGQPYYHLWYLYMIICLYMVTPFIYYFVKNCSRQLLFWAVVVSFFMASVNSILKSIENGWTSSFFASWPPFVGYFLCGYYITTYRPAFFRHKAVWVIAAACWIALALVTGLLFPVLGHRAWEVMYSSLNPLIIGMSVCVFGTVWSPDSSKLTKQTFIGGLIDGIAPLTMGIYLVHPALMHFSKSIGVSGLFGNPLLSIPFSTLFVFTLSAAAAFLMSLVPGLRRVVK
jgi:surface polysaccharide O-acyltransferase-like enzyme